MKKWEYPKCNLCGKDNAQFLFSGYDLWYNLDIPSEEKEGFKMVRCKHCGLVYLNPRINPLYVHHYYPESYISHNPQGEKPFPIQPPSLFPIIRKKIFVDLYGLNPSFFSLEKKNLGFLGKFLLPRFWLKIFTQIIYFKSKPLFFNGAGLKILDIGCGKGLFLAQMKKFHWQTFGVEPNPNQDCLKFWRQAGLFNIKRGIFKASDWKKNFFDFVTLHQVIEHLPEPQVSLKDIYQILKPKGFLLIQTPNFRSLAAKLFKEFWIGVDLPRHYYLFTLQTIKRMLENAGFQILRYYTVSSTNGYTAALEFFLRERGKLKITQDKVRKNKVLCYFFKPLCKLADLWRVGDNLYIIAKKANH